MQRYNKLWVALGVPVVVLGLRALGADVQADAATEQQVDALGSILVPVLTAFGVWATPNR